jgi:hypothetical protein
MGLVIGVLTVALSVARQSVVQRFRSMLPKINRVAGGLIVLAGLYVAYYGWYEVRVFSGKGGDDPIIDRARRIQGRLTSAVVPDDPLRVAILLTSVLIAAAAWTMIRRRRLTEDEPGM